MSKLFVLHFPHAPYCTKSLANTIRSPWESFDGYAAASGERVINLYLTTSGTHTLEVRNRPERNAANTTGYKLRFKQLAVLNTVYDTTDYVIHPLKTVLQSVILRCLLFAAAH